MGKTALAARQPMVPDAEFAGHRSGSAARTRLALSGKAVPAPSAPVSAQDGCVRGQFRHSLDLATISVLGMEAAVAKHCSSTSLRCGSCLRCGRQPCAAWQGPRSIMRAGRTVVTYRGCFRWLLVVVAAVAGLLAAGMATGLLLPTGAAAGGVVLVWAVATMRVIRLAPTCGWPGGAGPGGSGTREPRRPKPGPPEDAISLPLPEDPPGGAAALA
ncbi:hypothetical protein [Streptomyces tailanensis]|uniref:hypothetical protein n=1 Tax=Streptomyces tailanensis TaxID=2569858 RepID=UPI00122E1724|nr:hypothetical protein [Streptomyces tailanensis]